MVSERSDGSGGDIGLVVLCCLAVRVSQDMRHPSLSMPTSTWVRGPVVLFVGLCQQASVGLRLLPQERPRRGRQG